MDEIIELDTDGGFDISSESMLPAFHYEVKSLVKPSGLSKKPNKIEVKIGVPRDMDTSDIKCSIDRVGRNAYIQLGDREVSIPVDHRVSHGQSQAFFHENVLTVHLKTL